MQETLCNLASNTGTALLGSVLQGALFEKVFRHRWGGFFEIQLVTVKERLQFLGGNTNGKGLGRFESKLYS